MVTTLYKIFKREADESGNSNNYQHKGHVADVPKPLKPSHAQEEASFEYFPPFSGSHFLMFNVEGCNNNKVLVLNKIISFKTFNMVSVAIIALLVDICAKFMISIGFLL